MNLWDITTLISNLALPIFLIIILVLFFLLAKNGKIGKFKPNEIFQPDYQISGSGNTLTVGEELNPDGTIDSKQIANRMSILLQEYHIKV